MQHTFTRAGQRHQHPIVLKRWDCGVGLRPADAIAAPAAGASQHLEKCRAHSDPCAFWRQGGGCGGWCTPSTGQSHHTCWHHTTIQQAPQSELLGEGRRALPAWPVASVLQTPQAVRWCHPACMHAAGLSRHAQHIDPPHCLPFETKATPAQCHSLADTQPPLGTPSQKQQAAHDSFQQP